MTKKLIEHYFKHFKEDSFVNLVLEGNEIFAINKVTNCKQIFVNSDESIKIADKKDLEKVKDYIGGGLPHE